MALRKLKAQKRKTELTARSAEVENDLAEVLADIEELIRLSDELDENGTDEQKEELLDLDDQLEEQREKLTAEQREIAEELEAVEAELEKYGKGETVKEQQPKLEVRDALNVYLHKKDVQKEQVRAAGLVSDDAEVLIPEEIIYQPRDEVYTEQDLEQYINTVSVSTPTGKYPVLLRTQEQMHTVAELNENPRLRNPEFKQVMWEVDTYRGYIPISQEAIDDSAVDLVGLIARHILRITLNTTNGLVAPLIKSYQSAIATSLDDLKKLDDTMLDPAYSRAFYMSRSMYHYLNTMKDKDGDYVLQRDITSPSGKSLFGWPIIRINDNLIGDYNGQLVCFFGDLKAAITKFNRKQISAQWNDNDLYATDIQAGFRAGYSVTDEKAGYYVFYAPPEKDIELSTSDEQTPETVDGVSAEITVENNTAVIKYTGLTEQPIAYGLKIADSDTVVAEMKGRFESVMTDDQITLTFSQDMVRGDYTLEAKVLDSKKYKVIKSAKLSIKQKSEEFIKSTNRTPLYISGK